MSILAVIAVLALVCGSFAISASAGLGGSLLMVPTLVLFLEPKQGAALAALLLASNNVFKIIAYRKTLPFRAAGLIVVLVAVGAALGAQMLVNAPASLVTVAVVTMFAGSMAAERYLSGMKRASLAPLMAFASGAASGFSGTSGPLKGAAIRNLSLDRRHFVGAASLASFAGDATKTAIFSEAGLLTHQSVLLAVAAVPLMAVGTWTGSRINSRSGERAFAVLFWLVMAGYTARLAYFAFNR